MTDTPAARTCCTTGTCSTCQFWEEKVHWHNNGDQMPAHRSQPCVPVARVNGWHYVVQPMDTTTPGQYLGFGGQLFTFHFADGRHMTSNDVMCQGEIPPHFRDRLPDNAVIVPHPVAPTRTSFGATEGLL